MNPFKEVKKLWGRPSGSAETIEQAVARAAAAKRSKQVNQAFKRLSVDNAREVLELREQGIREHGAPYMLHGQEPATVEAARLVLAAAGQRADAGTDHNIIPTARFGEDSANLFSKIRAVFDSTPAQIPTGADYWRYEAWEGIDAHPAMPLSILDERAIRAAVEDMPLQRARALYATPAEHLEHLRGCTESGSGHWDDCATCRDHSELERIEYDEREAARRVLTEQDPQFRVQADQDREAAEQAGQRLHRDRTAAAVAGLRTDQLLDTDGQALDLAALRRESAEYAGDLRGERYVLVSPGGGQMVVSWEELVELEERDMTPAQAREVLANHLANTNGLPELVTDTPSDPGRRTAGHDEDGRTRGEFHHARVRAALHITAEEILARETARDHNEHAKQNDMSAAESAAPTTYAEALGRAQRLQHEVFHAYTLDNTPRGFVHGGDVEDPDEFDDYSDLVASTEGKLRQHLLAHPELEQSEEFGGYYGGYQEEIDEAYAYNVAVDEQVATLSVEEATEITQTAASEFHDVDGDDDLHGDHIREVAARLVVRSNTTATNGADGSDSQVERLRAEETAAERYLQETITDLEEHEDAATEHEMIERVHLAEEGLEFARQARVTAERDLGTQPAGKATEADAQSSAERGDEPSAELVAKYGKDAAEMAEWERRVDAEAAAMSLDEAERLVAEEQDRDWHSSRCDLDLEECGKCAADVQRANEEGWERHWLRLDAADKLLHDTDLAVARGEIQPAQLTAAKERLARLWQAERDAERAADQVFGERQDAEPGAVSSPSEWVIVEDAAVQRVEQATYARQAAERAVKRLHGGPGPYGPDEAADGQPSRQARIQGGERAAELDRLWLAEHKAGSRLWHMETGGFFYSDEQWADARREAERTEQARRAEFPHADKPTNEYQDWRSQIWHLDQAAPADSAPVQERGEPATLDEQRQREQDRHDKEVRARSRSRQLTNELIDRGRLTEEFATILNYKAGLPAENRREQELYDHLDWESGKPPRNDRAAWMHNLLDQNPDKYRTGVFLAEGQEDDGRSWQERYEQHFVDSQLWRMPVWSARQILAHTEAHPDDDLRVRAAVARKVLEQAAEREEHLRAERDVRYRNLSEARAAVATCKGQVDGEVAVDQPVRQPELTEQARADALIEIERARAEEARAIAVRDLAHVDQWEQVNEDVARASLWRERAERTLAQFPEAVAARTELVAQPVDESPLLARAEEAPAQGALREAEAPGQARGAEGAGAAMRFGFTAPAAGQEVTSSPGRYVGDTGPKVIRSGGASVSPVGAGPISGQPAGAATRGADMSGLSTRELVDLAVSHLEAQRVAEATEQASAEESTSWRAAGTEQDRSNHDVL